MKKTKNIRLSEELALIKKAQAGDDRAFTQLVKKYENLVYSFAFKVCRNKEKAEETWQDTFVNVYRKLKQFDGKSKFTTWLYSIVTNNCRMKHRKTKLEMSSIHLDKSSTGKEQDEAENSEESIMAIHDRHGSPLEKMMNSELRDKLDAAIQKLSYEYRVVFILRDVEGQSTEEVGKILKLSVPAVKSRLRRARVFLREQLNEYVST